MNALGLERGETTEVLIISQIYPSQLLSQVGSQMHLTSGLPSMGLTVTTHPVVDGCGDPRITAVGYFVPNRHRVLSRQLDLYVTAVESWTPQSDTLGPI